MEVDPIADRDEGEKDDRAGEERAGGPRREGARGRGRGHHLGRGRLARGDRFAERIAAGQGRRHLDDRGRPPRRVVLQAAADEAGHGRIEARGGGRIERDAGLPLAQHRRHRRGIEVAAAGEQLEEEEAQRVDLALPREGPTRELLRRHVGRRPRRVARPPQIRLEAGQAEVRDPGAPPAVEHHVRRLEVAVQDAGLVGGGEPRADLPRDLEGLVLGQAADAPGERGHVLAVDVLHREEVLAVRLADVEDAAHRGVRDLAREAHLLVEAGEGGAVPGEGRRQELQRHRLGQLEVVGPVDLPHPAPAEEADDPVAAPDHRARHEPPAVRRRRRRCGQGLVPGPRLGRRVLVRLGGKAHPPSSARRRARSFTFAAARSAMIT
ncbi:MAG: hypothetical protein U0599_22040 [Vicinamibacteria bacterium]